MTEAICGGVAYEWRRIDMCPTEGRRRRVYGWTSSLWYAPRWTCLGCGDSWSDGEMAPRPFARGWRQRAIAEARESWRNARTMTKAQFRRAVEAELAR